MSAGGPDQPSFHEHSQHLRAGHSPHRIHIGPCDGLAIGDNGQRLHRGGGQSQVRCRSAEPNEPRFERGSGEELEAASDIGDLKGRAVGVVQSPEFGDQRADFGGIGQTGGISQPSSGQRFVGQEQGGFQACQFGVAGQWIGRVNDHGLLCPASREMRAGIARAAKPLAAGSRADRLWHSGT